MGRCLAGWVHGLVRKSAENLDSQNSPDPRKSLVPVSIPSQITVAWKVCSFDECHEKTDLKVFVIVIPKKGVNTLGESVNPCLLSGGGGSLPTGRGRRTKLMMRCRRCQMPQTTMTKHISHALHHQNKYTKGMGWRSPLECMITTSLAEMRFPRLLVGTLNPY